MVSISLRLADSNLKTASAWCPGEWQLSVGTQLPIEMRESGWSAFRLKPQEARAGLRWELYWHFDMPTSAP
jgi:hypothetical protein